MNVSWRNEVVSAENRDNLDVAIRCLKARMARLGYDRSREPEIETSDSGGVIAYKAYVWFSKEVRNDQGI